MEKFEQMIENIIQDLDWRMILDFYDKLNLTWYGKDILKKNSLEKRKPTIEELQNELRTVCRFVIHKGMSEFIYERWTILWLDPKDFDEEEFNKKDDFGCQLEVIFSPTRALTFENTFEELEPEDEIDPIEMETDVLVDMLNKAVDKEEYEIASKLRDKIFELKEELKNPVKVNKEKS